MVAGAPSGLWAVVSRMLKARLMSRAGRPITFMARVRRGDLIVLKDLAEAGTLSPVIDRQYPLSEVPDAIRYLGTRQARGKVVISVT